MINNIQNLFGEHISKLETKKNIKKNTILYVEEVFLIKISSKNLKIDIKNKEIHIINLSSSYRFVLNSKINHHLNDFKNKFNFTIKI